MIKKKLNINIPLFNEKINLKTLYTFTQGYIPPKIKKKPHNKLSTISIVKEIGCLPEFDISEVYPTLISL